jgi:hypothetical protein
MAMLRPNDEMELQNKIRNGIGHSICHFSKTVRIETAGFRRGAARIWFHFVERVTRNHIDEWLLIHGQYQEGPCEPRRRFKSRRAGQGQ